MDTWATSSLTPQIAGQAGQDPDLYAKVFPMDVRPQAHDIIRTWLFSTILRSELDEHELPWSNAAISGWVLDPDRKKMSKSKGNVVTPMHLLEEHGADAVSLLGGQRAAGNGYGLRPAADEGRPPPGGQAAQRVQVRAGGAPAPGRGARGHPLDRALIARLAAVVGRGRAGSFEEYDYARALQRTEEFFWWYCDYYLELVKGRRYDPDPAVAASVSRALTLSLSVFQRLFAPFMPFVCAEVWSWWQEGSVHRAAWPLEGGELAAEAAGGEPARELMALDVGADVLREVRKAKSQAKRPMRAPVTRVLVRDRPERLEALELAAEDLRMAGSIELLETEPAEELAVEVTLAEEPSGEA